MIDAPERSTQQRRDALDTANRVRTYRAEMKRQIRERELPPDHFFRVGRRDPLLATMKLLEALKATPTIGVHKAPRVLQRAGMSPSRTLGGLSSAQFTRLMAALGEFPALMRRLEDWDRCGPR